MNLTPEIEAAGLKAYEQVCAFESLQRRGLPWIYAGFTLVLVGLAVGTWFLGQPKMAIGFVPCAIFFGLWTWTNWQQQKAKYAKNVELVHSLEATYGDQLTWVKVEKHFAQLEELEREIAEDKSRNQ